MDELSAKYQAVSVEEVEEGWKDVYERSLTHCMHGPSCQTGPSCQASYEYVVSASREQGQLHA